MKLCSEMFYKQSMPYYGTLCYNSRNSVLSTVILKLSLTSQIMNDSESMKCIAQVTLPVFVQIKICLT